MLLDSTGGELVVCLFVAMPTKVPIQFSTSKDITQSFQLPKDTNFDIGVPEITEANAICFLYLLFLFNFVEGVLEICRVMKSDFLMGGIRKITTADQLTLVNTPCSLRNFIDNLVHERVKRQQISIYNVEVYMQLLKINSFTLKY